MSQIDTNNGVELNLHCAGLMQFPWFTWFSNVTENCKATAKCAGFLEELWLYVVACLARDCMDLLIEK